jgi:hypothetical protein
MKKIEITMTARNARMTGFVNQGILSKIGGKIKSFALGGTNPSPSAAKRKNVCTHTP